MHREPRNASIDKVVVHVNQGPDTHNGAHGLASYLGRIEAGYHKIADDLNIVTCAGDDEVVWGAGGMNRHGLHVCIIGDANQTFEQWHDPFSSAATRNAAVAVATWCHDHQIPVVKLTPGQVATSGVKGICGHKDVEISGLPNTGGSSGHYDPGPHFPWDEFIRLVAHMLDPADPVEEDADVPKPTDVTGSLETKYGHWQLRANGSVKVLKGKSYGSYQTLSKRYNDRARTFFSIRDRLDRKPGYVLVSTDGNEYAFTKK